MVNEKNDQEKALKKWRLLKAVNKVLVGLGILFFLYVAFMYVSFFLYTHQMAK